MDTLKSKVNELKEMAESLAREATALELGKKGSTFLLDEIQQSMVDIANELDSIDLTHVTVIKNGVIFDNQSFIKYADAERLFKSVLEYQFNVINDFDIHLDNGYYEFDDMNMSVCIHSNKIK